MKRIIQLVLFSFLIIMSFIFYTIYFQEDKKKLEVSQITELPENQNNNSLIRNLEYQVKLDNDAQYKITADLSEVYYDGDTELVNMQKVIAIFLDEKNIPLVVTSNRATYNGSNHNTNFRDNVQINYINSIIYADKMDLDFNLNTIKIFENVRYDGIQGNMSSDNIDIDLITQKIDIYMNNNNDDVKVITKR